MKDGQCHNVPMPVPLNVPGTLPAYQGRTATRRPSAVRRAAFAGVATLALAVSAAGATVEPARVAEFYAAYAARAEFALPGLSADDLAELARGEAVIRVSGTPAPGTDEVSAMGVAGIKLIAAPRLLLWLSVMGGNDERDYRLTPLTLSRGNAGSYVRYQHVDLPWPIRDRHWVIDCRKNPGLAEATGGKVWEHSWALHTEGPALIDEAFTAGRIPKLSRDDLDDAVYLPANRGAWALVETGPDHTLVIGYLDADLGGRFPDPLVRAFTKRQLKAGLVRLEEMATRVHDNYDGEPPIHDGAGRPIAAPAALRVATRWRNAPAAR